MVAGQEVHRNLDAAHGRKRLADHLRRQLVGIEHIAGHHDKLRTGPLGERAQSRDHITAGSRITRLSVVVQEVPGHSQLPVRGVYEAHSPTTFLPRCFSPDAAAPARVYGRGLTSPGPSPAQCPNLGRMRTLVLMRHAKSDYPDGVADHDRPLAARGVREAALAGDWLRGAVPAIDAVLCSTAVRTRQTLERTGVGAPVSFIERLYGATPGALLAEINQVDEQVTTLLVVGHEPTVSQVSLGLAGHPGSDPEAIGRIETKFPTSGIAVLRVPGIWSALEVNGAELVSFHVPR